MTNDHYASLKLYQLHDLLKEAKTEAERQEIWEAIKRREVAIGSLPPASNRSSESCTNVR